LYNKLTDETLCETLRCEKIQEEDSTHNSGESGNKAFLVQPFICTCMDSRSEIGKVMINSLHQVIEICWMFPLTKEKFRMKSTLALVNIKSEI